MMVVVGVSIVRTSEFDDQIRAGCKKYIVLKARNIR